MHAGHMQESSNSSAPAVGFGSLRPEAMQIVHVSLKSLQAQAGSLAQRFFMIFDIWFSERCA